MHDRKWIFGLPFLSVLLLPCCSSTTPKNAFVLSAQSLERRQVSSRRFDTTNEKQILTAAADLLQDLGFTLDASETNLGLIVASKDRSAVEGGQVAGKIAAGVLLWKHVAIDKRQRFRASIVTRPARNGIIVRATFQRIVWNEDGQITRRELMDDPNMYHEFFDKLSKAVFLQAHHI